MSAETTDQPATKPHRSRAAMKIGIAVLFIFVFVGARSLYESIQYNDVEPEVATASGEIPQPSPISFQTAKTAVAPAAPKPLEAGSFAKADQAAVNGLVAKFNTGDYLGAVTLADAAIGNPQLSLHFQNWLKEQMPVVLISAGWIKIKLADCDEGMRLLSRAEGYKKSPESAKGLAYCHQKLGNIAAADEYFHSYLEQSPQDPEMHLLYSDTLESQGRFVEAVQSLETALGHSVIENRPAIEQRLAAMKLRSKESRVQSTDSSRNFTISYRSGDHEELAGLVLETLELALDEFVEDYGYKEPPTKLEVVLYPFEQFRGIVVGGPEWAEGVFDGRLRIPIKIAEVRARDFSFLKTVLRHELVHALNAMMSGGRQLPPWFEEGLAQRLSCPRSGCAKFQFPPTPGKFLPPSNFFAPYITLDAVAAGQAYRQSLYMIYSLEELKTGDDVLRSLVRGLNSSGSLDSDAVLLPNSLTFTYLYARAEEWWNGRMFK